MKKAIVPRNAPNLSGIKHASDPIRITQGIIDIPAPARNRTEQGRWTETECVDMIIDEARKRGYAIEDSRNGRQINFGHKKLHEGHLTALCPDIFCLDARIPTLINKVAPGRPCAHKPMREIVESINAKLG